MIRFKPFVFALMTIMGLFCLIGCDTRESPEALPAPESTAAESHVETAEPTVAADSDAPVTVSASPSAPAGSPTAALISPAPAVSPTPAPKIAASASELTAEPAQGELTFTEWESPNGVKIERMSETGLSVLNAACAGLDPASEDNTDALQMLFNYAAKNPNTRIVIPEGTYYFSPSQDITLNGAENIMIDGQGAEFIFRTIYYFELNDCENVEFRDLVIDWDWENSRLGNLMQVVRTDGRTVDFLLPEVEDVNVDDLTFRNLNEFDPDTLTPGTADGKEFSDLTFGNVEKLSGNTIRVSGLSCGDSLEVGEIYLERNYIYEAQAFTVLNTDGIVFSNVSVYGVPGIAFVLGYGTEHMLFWDTVVGLRPGEEAHRRISSTADAVHLFNTDGDLWIEGCDFSFMGDDAVNIHDITALVSQVCNSRTVILESANAAPAKGDELEFFSADYEPLGFTAEVAGMVSEGIILDRDLPTEVTENCIVYNREYDSGDYYIADSYFHENRARGILAQSSNGLITNCVFEKTQGAAILIITDINPGYWYEGTGVDGLTVSGCTFETCNVGNWTSVIVLEARVRNRVVPTAVLKNITVTDNYFSNFPSRVLDIASAEHVVFSGNTIRNGNDLANASKDRGKIRIEKARDIELSDNTWMRSSYMPEDVTVPIAYKESVTGLITGGNRVAADP